MCSRKLAWGARSGGSLAYTAITSAGIATLTAAKPYTACQPNFCASMGASRAATRHAQQDAHGEQVVVRMHEQVAVAHGHKDPRHLDQRGVLATDVLRQDAQRKPHEGARKDGNGQHHAHLRRCELEGIADERCHGTVDHPDCARETEIQKGRPQRWGVAGLEKLSKLKHGDLAQRGCCAAASTPTTGQKNKKAPTRAARACWFVCKPHTSHEDANVLFAQSAVAPG